MAINRETLRLADELRIIIDDTVDVTTRQLVEAWARAWDQINSEWELAIADLVAKSRDGRWPPRIDIARADRAQRALAISQAEVIRLAEFTGIAVVTAAREVTDEVAEWQARLIASQMPPVAGGTAELVAVFNRIDPDVLGAIVERSTERITAATFPLSAEATDAMYAALVRGVAIGDNPVTAARNMVRKVEGRFNGGLTRALTIARTEILDAHRSGAAAAQFANSDVLAGWIWHAELDIRTCPSCWSQHGRLYRLEEIGPIDHQNGRCARTPKSKTWRQLGFDIDEPPDLMPDARAAFDDLSRADQLRIMGPTRLHALDNGMVAWAGLSTLRQTDGWRDSYVPTRAQDVQRKVLMPV